MKRAERLHAKHHLGAALLEPLRRKLARLAVKAREDRRGKIDKRDRHLGPRFQNLCRQLDANCAGADDDHRLCLGQPRRRLRATDADAKGLYRPCAATRFELRGAAITRILARRKKRATAHLSPRGAALLQRGLGHDGLDRLLVGASHREHQVVVRQVDLATVASDHADALDLCADRAQAAVHKRVASRGQRARQVAQVRGVHEAAQDTWRVLKIILQVNQSDFQLGMACAFSMHDGGQKTRACMSRNGCEFELTLHAHPPIATVHTC
eukprot:6191851-Pleurochrysis_carterae.AAC.6